MSILELIAVTMRMTMLISQFGQLPILVAERDSTMIDSSNRIMRSKRFFKGRAAEKPNQACP